MTYTCQNCGTLFQVVERLTGAARGISHCAVCGRLMWSGGFTLNGIGPWIEMRAEDAA